MALVLLSHADERNPLGPGRAIAIAIAPRFSAHLYITVIYLSYFYVIQNNKNNNNVVKKLERNWYATKIKTSSFINT